MPLNYGTIIDRETSMSGADHAEIRQALEDGYRTLVFVDSDIVASADFLSELQAFLL